MMCRKVLLINGLVTVQNKKKGVTMNKLSPIAHVLRPMLPEVGKIKIGAKGEIRKSRGGNEYRLPTKLDHFLVTTMERDQETENFLPNELIMKKLGESKTLNVQLLYNRIELNFPSRLIRYKGTKVQCSGDGRFGHIREDSGVREIECPCKYNDFTYTGSDRCKLNGTLSCILTDFTDCIGGVFKFRTTSINSIEGITSSLAYIHNLTGGILANIPLRLVLDRKTSVDRTGVNREISFVRVEFAGSYQELLSEAKQIRDTKMQYIEMSEKTAENLVTAEVPEDEVTDVQEEYYPPEVIVDETTGEIRDVPDLEEEPKPEPKKRGRPKKEPVPEVEDDDDDVF